MQLKTFKPFEVSWIWLYGDPNRAAWEIRKLRSDLNQAFHNEEVFWKLKSRNKWLQVGDRNTAYFHGVTKARKPRTCIKRVVDEAGIVHTKDEAIAKVAEEYFQQMFTASETLDIDDVIPVMDQRVTEAMNAILLRPVTDMEIKLFYLLDQTKLPVTMDSQLLFIKDFGTKYDRISTSW
ncbi:unnamed protein product [Microthlaspi erraticum]|uniref:Uncharacterized protein n=1 Tax=Microthlaspi erraticum TaxID=1685480 RepID=A0A6D2KPS8_9BRAS|nr:unnamed protein product [Microthlaspi erraticum]